MKKITLALFLLAASVGVQAQDFSQTTSLDIVPGTVTCGSQTPPTTAINSVYRAYNLPTLGVTADYAVSSVQFGLQTIQGETQVTVNLYATTANFPTGFTTVPGPQYSLIGTEVITVDDTDAGSIIDVPFATAAVVPVGSKLVIEVSNEAVEFSFALASNDLGQTATAYIVADACQISAPTPFSELGFADVHMIVNVSGSADPLSVKNNTLDQVSVYPNPTSGLVQVNLPASVEILSVSVSDLSGKQMNANVSGNSVDMSNFASGIYMLNVNTTEGNLVRKVQKN